MSKLLHIKRPARHLRSAALALVCLALPAMQPLADGVSEHTLKAAVAHKITKFVSWPDHALGAEGAPLRFCVSEEGPVQRALDSLKGHAIHGRPLEVATLSEPRSAADNCDILYVASTAGETAEHWLAAVADRPILTFGEAERYGEYVSIVTMGIRRNKVRFDINIEASERAGLTIGAQLLQLAAMSNRRGR